MTTDEAIHALVRQGAALLFAADPNQSPVGVAWWRRVNARRHFYFAPGWSSFDAHVLEFASEQVAHGGLGVAFLNQDGNMIAYLTTVEEQEFDPVAAAQLKARIQAWKDVFEKEERARASVLSLYHRAG